MSSSASGQIANHTVCDLAESANPPRDSLNPYRCSAAIRDVQDFYGREYELRRTFDALRKWECVNVVGERRSGKTSFLRHLAHPEVQLYYDRGGADSSLYVYLDAEVLPQNPCEFFREIITQVRARWPELSDFDPATLDAEHCERQVRQFLQGLTPRRLVLLMDEFESIATCSAFPLRFFEFLRGLSQTYNLSYVAATCLDLKNSCSQEYCTSPFFNIFRPVTMGPFAPTEFEHFVRETSSRCQVPIYQVREEILDLAGYRPYLDQMVCSHYFYAYLEKGSLEQTHELVWQRFSEEAAPHFASVWSTYLSHEERRALQLLAHGSQEADADSLRLLEKKGHVCDGHIASAPFAVFIRRQDALPEIRDQIQQLSPDAKPITQPGIVVDQDSGHVHVEGELLDPPLPENQFKLLSLLYHKKGKICDSYEVVSAVWGTEYLDEVDDQRIAQLFTRLRKRIEQGERPWKYIITVHGRGWTLGG